MMENLESHYSGHQQWYEAVELFYDFWTGIPEQQALLKSIDGKIDIAIMMIGKYGNADIKRLDHHLPALGNRTIRECLSDPDLTIRVREMLMRIPI